MALRRRDFPYLVILILVAFFASVFLSFSTHVNLYANTKTNGEARSSGNSISDIFSLSISSSSDEEEVKSSIFGTDELNEGQEIKETVGSNIAEQQLQEDGSESKQSKEEQNLETGKPRFAYAFLIAGCDPKQPNYKGYIYSVAVAKELFNRFNTTHDIIVHVRMHAETEETKLPPEDEEILTKSGLIVKYLPKPLIDNFHTAMMDKFRILQLTEYSRVVYLDADVIPLNNIDYVFDLSVPTKEQPDPPLEENLILAYNREPSSGGFFMMAPKEGDYEKIMELVEKRNKEGYHFNETIGWGHQMIPPDGWESLAGFEGSNWDFYGSFTDQGLIYHWTKYVKKKVTQANGPRLKTFKEDENGNIVAVRDVDGKGIFKDYPKDFHVRPSHHSRSHYQLATSPPYRDFHHFKEFFKPWVAKKSHRKDHGPHELWYEVLREINEKHKFGIDVDQVEKTGFDKPNLGLFPTFNMVEQMKKLHGAENGESSTK